MSIGQAVSGIVAIVKMDGAKVILPALASFLNDVAANPSGLNLTVKLAKLQIDVIAALPSIETDVLKQLATEINNEAQTLLAPAMPATPAAP